MRRIQKGPEPPSWSVRRATDGATSWAAVHGSERQQAREHAFAEQHGLCAYCLSSLSGTDQDAMKLEHWRTRADRPKFVLHWPNVLGVCMGDVGGDGAAAERFHCDTYRGLLPPKGQALHVDPASFPPDAADCFRYLRSTGEIVPNRALDEAQVEQVQKTIDRLNLNIDRLKRNRAAIIQRLRARIKSGKMTRATLTQLLGDNRIPHNGRLPPYCEVAAQYLEAKKREKGW